MHSIGVKSQRRSQPGFPRFSLPPTPQGAQRPAASKSLAKGRASQPERQKPNAGKTQRKGCDASPVRRPSASLSQAVEDEGMLRVPAYNSKKEAFHHANSQCGLGLRIAPHNRVSGTGNKPLCKNCQKLNDEEAVKSAVTAERATIRLPLRN
jgi:hypothetical protein